MYIIGVKVGFMQLYVLFLNLMMSQGYAGLHVCTL